MESEWFDDSSVSRKNDMDDEYIPENLGKNRENGFHTPNRGRSPNRPDMDIEYREYNLRSRNTDFPRDHYDDFEYKHINQDKSTQNTLMKYLKPGFSPETGLDIDFEESIRYFEYSLDKVRVFWTIPLKRLLDGEGTIRLDSITFPTGWKKKWKLIADIDKSDQGLARCYIGLEAILDEREKNDPEWERNVNIVFRITLRLGSLDTEKAFVRTFNPSTRDYGIQLPEKMLPQINLVLNDALIIECTIKENKRIQTSSSNLLGLINSGNLCYMNSFLQTLYNLAAFQKLIFKVPHEKSNGNTSLLIALQRLFYNLKFSKKPVSTGELIKSFGWDRRQANVQQDVQEFCLLFLEALEKKMKDIPELDGQLNKLFEGKTITLIKCLDVDYESKRAEKFVELQLMVKGCHTIYESLDLFITEEILDGDNKLETDQYGKQDAKKGQKILTLPPVLMVQLKRFEFDYQKETMVKVSDYCEFYDEIDLEKYTYSENVQETRYKLFSVLVHSGGSATSGHYYAFIRPNPEGDGQWYKFNDDIVDLAEPDEVFEANFGGTHTEARLNKSKEIETWESSNPANAYMLVYIRIDRIKELLSPVTEKDVPAQLREEIETNKKLEEERRRKNDEYIKIYITSFELLKSIQEPGLTFYKMGARDDDYIVRFLKSKNKRFKVYLKKNFKVQDLMKFISDNTHIPIEELMVWKISTNREQFTPVTKRSLLGSGGTSLNILCTGVNQNQSQTKAIFFVHTITRNNYPYIFKLREPYHSEYFGIKCKNTVEFVEYDPEIEIMQDIPEDEKVENIVFKRAGPILNDLMDEKYLFIFLKVYTVTGEKPVLRMLDYYLMRKNALVRDLIDELQQKYSTRDFSKATFYREDKKKYLLEKLSPETPIDDESAEYGHVFVFEFIQDRSDYVTAAEYYKLLSERVWVTFIPNPKDNREGFRKLLDGGMRYDELTQYISDHIYGSEVPPSRIIIKSKWKNAFNYNPISYADSLTLTLADLVKHDERVQCEESKIEVEELDRKQRVMISYYSFITNTLTKEEELFMDKDATVLQLIDEIESKNIFIEQRLADMEKMDGEFNLKAVVLEKKKNVLIGRAVPDQEISLYMQKYRLRVEYILKMYEEKSEDKYFPVYGVQTTRDGETFSHPFLFFARKSYTGEEFRTRLFNVMKNWNIDCAGKEIKINQEYFGKLRLIVKTDLSDSRYAKVENDDSYPLQELEEGSKKFTLEVIHPFNMPKEQPQMKINV